MDEMDLEEKLKLIRRGKPTRPGKIDDAWKDIEKDENLSTKEKLQKLISLTQTERPSAVHKPPAESQPKEPLQFYENHYSMTSRYGKIPIAMGLNISSDILSLLSRDAGFTSLDLSTALFLDLETTGLSGGTGVIPFLVGMGFYKDGQFHVAQFFLGELGEEERFIRELNLFFSQMNFQSIVSFNGKGFDMPLLETRFILHREPFPLSGLPHLDFLFPARNLWKHKHESCRLFHLAREILHADRAEDIPSAEIPTRYFQYVRTGDFSLMEPVLYHNQEDILSLLGVVISGALVFIHTETDSSDSFGDSMDLFGAAKLLENAGEVEKSIQYIERAISGELTKDVALQAKKKLSYYFKKNRDWDKAVSLWKEMTPLNQLFCYRELAMYFEHKEKDCEEAKRIAEEGLSLAMEISPAFYEDFSHRLGRLEKKIRKLKEAREE